MSLINISQLTFAYDGSYENIFENVSLQLDTNWKLGLIGRNGRGKTTFLNLLQRKFHYQGSISASVSFDYFPFSIQQPEKYGYELMEEIVPDYEYWRLSKELNLLNISDEVLYRPFQTLSNGEQTKVLLAALFMKENHFLLIDEPTNHLDINGRESVSAYLNKKKGFILVSHDRMFLDRCVDHVLSINKTNIELQKGNFSSWYQNKMYQDQNELDQNKKLKSEIRQLSQAAKRSADWSNDVEKTKYATRNSGLRPDRGYIGHQSAKMMKRAKSIYNRQQKKIEEKSTLLKNIEAVETLTIHPATHHSKVLIEAKNFSIYYNGEAIFKPMNFTIQSGDRVQLSGPNGCGKSSLIKLIVSENITFTGELKKASQLKLSVIPQDTSFLSGTLKEFILNNAIDETLFKTILRKLGFDRALFNRELSSYSPGQRKKVLIAKSLCESAHLYLWDEPLNYIDIFSRMQIESLIMQYQPTLLFSEHDQCFANAVSTKKILFQ